jgi:hypothetical protein
MLQIHAEVLGDEPFSPKKIQEYPVDANRKNGIEQLLSLKTSDITR